MQHLSFLRQNPRFRVLLAAQMPSDFSHWLDFVAIGVVLSFSWQVDPIVFAWLGAALGLPYLLVGPLAGALVDRWDLRRVLILCNLGRAAATVALVFVETVPLLLSVAFLRSSINAFYGPAKQAAITTLVPAEQRMAANGLSHAINQASKVIGPSIGGGLLIFLEPQGIFLVNGGVSVLAAVILLRLSVPCRPAQGPGERPPALWKDLREGLVEIRSKLVILTSLILMALGYFAIFLYDRFIPLLVRDYGFGQNIFSLAVVAVGAGGVIGALGIGVLTRQAGGFGVIAAGSLVISGLLFLLGGGPVHGLTMPAVPFIAVFALIGAVSTAVVVPFRTLLQRHTEESRIARVFAASEALNVGAMLSAPFFGAMIAEAAGTGAPFIAGSVGMVCLAGAAAVAGLAFRGPRRRADARAASTDPEP